MMPKLPFTRDQKYFMRAYALDRERAYNVVRVRFLSDGDVRAHCANGETYLIGPTIELFKEACQEAIRCLQQELANVEGVR